MPQRWIASRMHSFDASGIRKVFDLAAKMTDPVNLSIGQPDFDVPEPIRQVAIDAIQSGKNGYAQTQGIPALRDKIQERVDREYGHSNRRVFITSGTSGGLMLSMLTILNPGDEIIVFDPYFVMYDALAGVAGAKVVHVDTYPGFHIDLNRLEDAITDKTKAIVFNSPANPTGNVTAAEEVEALAKLCSERDILLLSDEIYRDFCYDRPFVSPAKFNDRTLVLDGFSKNVGMPGWRVGFAHGPAEIIEQMTKLQQYTFVCAPHPFQWAAAEALDYDMSETFAAYKKRRDMIVDGLSDLYELVTPGGAFYAFPKTPWGTGMEFVEQAIANNLLIIPGNVFSTRDTHFRISYAATEETIARGIEILRKLAKK